MKLPPTTEDSLTVSEKPPSSQGRGNHFGEFVTEETISYAPVKKIPETKEDPPEQHVHSTSEKMEMRLEPHPHLDASNATLFHSKLPITQRSQLSSKLHLSAVEGIHDAATNKHFTPSLSRRLYHQSKSKDFYSGVDRWDLVKVANNEAEQLHELMAVASNHLYGTRAASANSIRSRNTPTDMRQNVLFSASAVRKTPK